MGFIKQQSLHTRKVGDKTFVLTADGNMEMNLADGKEFKVDADLVITGNASGPKTDNVYYVSEAGSDDNDGRSADKNGAFASIKKAAEVAPSGSTIIVAPGDYYENNPITLRDFVTVTGQGELRNTRVFPKNDTQTIFFMGNGCYLYQITFRALRAPGWCAEIREGARVTTSPYIQNCTNMNGPWLNDGTEFIPFETVQIEGIEAGARPLLVEDYPDLPVGKQVNPDGGGGGLLVDGDKYDQSSLVFSFVADAFTQIAQGGIGFHITNFGYTQIVSCFSVFTSVGFLATKGGYLSISNSVSDFGTVGVKADGFYPIAYSDALPDQDYFSSVGSVTINTPGVGYTSAPTVIIDAPLGAGGTQATGTASIDAATGELNAVTIVTSGSGYDRIPTISFAGGGATVQATATANLSTNQFIDISSLRDKPQTGSIITFEGDDNYYYITSTDITTNPFVYNVETCKRDTRRIVDAVLGDIVLGTNYQSIAAGTSYLRATSSKVLLDQLAPTVYGIETARDEMKALTTNNALEEEIDNRFAIITQIINAGDSTGTPDLIWNELSSIEDEYINAKDNVFVNREFIIKELTAYINDQFTELSYNQGEFETTMKNFITATAYNVALGGDHLLIRHAQEYQTRERHEALLVDSFEYMRDTILGYTNVDASVTAENRVTEAFAKLTNLVTDGDSAGIVSTFDEHVGVETNRADAKDHLQANRDFIAAEFVAYIEDTYSAYEFTEATYVDAMEKYVDALTFDILYGGNAATKFETEFVYENLGVADLAATKRTQLEDAFARIRFVISRVVRGLSVTKTDGNAETQDTTSDNATQTEASELDGLIQITEAAINANSLSDIGTKTFPLFADESQALQDAANIIISNRDTLVTDAIAQNLANYPDLTYDITKCKRDVGYIIDAIYRDAQLGTNHNSITAGLAYKRANVAYLNEQQKPATILALRYAKDELKDAADGEAAFQNTVEELFEDVLDIIEFDQQPSSGQLYPEPGPASTELINALNQIVDNKTFLTKETVAFINNQYFVYDQSKCERDTGLIIDAAYYDAALGTNYNAVTAGLAYQRANSDYVISDQQTETVGAITFAKGEAQTSTSGDATAQSRVGAAFDEVLDIIQNGVESTDTAADPLVFAEPTTATAGQIAAKDQLQNNRAFLAKEAVAYVENNFEEFSYNRDEVAKEVEFVMDSISLDIALGTNYNAVTAGLSYQRAGTDYQTSDRKLQTLGYLTELKKQLVLLGLSDTGETKSNDAIDEVIDIVDNGTVSTNDAADTLVFPTPSSLPTTNAVEAKDQLIANKDFIIAEITAWIAVNYPSLTYDSDKCERDVGYIVDALCHDILYGGNSATIEAAKSYFIGSVSQLGGSDEVEATAAAYNRLGDVVGDIVIEATVVKSTGNAEIQDLTGTPASSTEADDVEGLVKIIEDVITAGSISGLPSTQLPSISWVSGGLQADYNTIRGNKDDTVEAIEIFIANTYQTFTYDETKCRRDVERIIDAAAYDATLGTNYNAITAGLAYQRANSSYVLSDQNLQTELAIKYVKERIGELEIETDFKNATDAAIDEILDIFKNGTVSTDDAADALTITDPNQDVNHIRAYNEIQNNKQFLIEENIAWIAANYPALTYDETKCRRDLGYILDALSYDILYDSNLASKNAAESYLVGTESQLGDSDEITATVAAYNELSLVLADVVQNIAHGSLEQSGVAQDTTGPGADATTATEVQQLLQIVEDVISAGSIAGMPADNAPDITWASADDQADFATVTGETSTIQDKVISYLNDTFTREFTFNNAKCERDTKYIVDALTYDILYGGDSATVNAARAYWVGTSSQVSGQQEETAASLGWLKTVLGDVLLDVIFNDPEQNVEGQDVSGAAAATSAEVTRANSLLTTFQNVIENGIDNLPSTTSYPDITWAASGIQAAVGTLNSDKQDIIDDTIDYIETTYNGFSYDQDKCERDTGYIIDAVAFDTLYTGNIATLIATRAYFLGAANYLPNEQKAATVAAYQHLADVIVKCVEGTAHTPTAGNTETQILSGNYGTGTESGIAYNLVQIVKNAVDAQSLAGTPSEIEPDFSWLPATTRSAAASMLAKKTTIQNDTVKYIQDSIIGFEYNEAKCERDTGYIIDAVLYDTLYGGNKQSRRAGLAYYSGTVLTVTNSDYTDQNGITAYSYYYLGDLLKKVALNDSVTRSYNNNLVQDKTIPDSTAEVGNNLKLLTDRIAKAVLDESTTGWGEVDHNYELGSGVYNTERLTILGSLETIVQNTIDAIGEQYGGEARINVFPGITSVLSTQRASLYNVSTISTSGHAFEYVGAGITYNALPFFGGVPIADNEIVQSNQGKVFAGGTVDQIGNFRVGDFFAVNALTGAITLNANQIDLEGLTSVGPFIRNGISVGVELKEVSNNANLVSSIGTQDINTAPTQKAVSTYVENRYLNKTTGGTVTGNIVLDGDFDINGSVLSTDVNSFDLLNTTAETINAFGAATTINIGAATGTVTINPDMQVEGSLTVNGDFTLTGDVSLNVPDESVQAFSITTEGSIDYISINTRTDNEKISFADRPTIEIQNTLEATDATTGALVVDGGIAVAKNVFIGDDLTAQGNVTLGNDRAEDTLDINATTDIDLPDDATDVLRIHENISDYMVINTTDGDEVVEFGATPYVRLLSNQDATDWRNGALRVAGGISAELAIFAGTDITAIRDITSEGNLNVNGTSISTRMDSGTFTLLNENIMTIEAFGEADNITIGADAGLLTINNEQVIIDSVASLQVPVGTDAERPSAATGQVRFNTDSTTFEGYDGTAWGALGGVKDVDQDTFIRPESTPGADEDQLEFFTANGKRATITNNEFIIESTNNVVVNNTDASEDVNSGALTVAGGAGFGKEIHVNDYVGGNSSGVLTLTNYASDKIVIKAETIETNEELKLISNLPDSAADDIAYPMTFAHHTQSGTPVAGSGTGIRFELETTNANFETGGQLDVIAQDVTSGQEDFDMVFSTMIGGSVVEKLRLGENTATLTTSLQVDNNLTVTGLLDAASITASIFADDSTEMLDAISNRLTVTTGQIGELTLTTDLAVEHGGTGVGTFTTDGILYGNTTDPVQVTDAAGTSDISESFQVLTVTSASDTTPVWTDTIDGGSF